MFLHLGGHRRAADVLDRYSSVWELYPEILSYLAYKLGTKKSFAPNGITIEPTNKCNLSCVQCDRRYMKRQSGRISMGLFKKIIEENGHIQRICFTAWGEPLLHPDICEMISFARKKSKYVLIFSNATLLTPKKVEQLIDSGLNSITFSLDGIGKVYEKVRGWSYQDVEQKIQSFISANNRKGHPSRVEINMVEFDETLGHSGELRRKWGNSVDAISVTPLMKTPKKRTVRCSKLWRSMVVYWDGTVVPCCVDKDATLAIGNVNENSLRRMFNGPRMRELREAHVRGDFPPICMTCNEYYT